MAIPARPMITVRFLPRRVNHGRKRSPTSAPMPVGAKTNAALSGNVEDVLHETGDQDGERRTSVLLTMS